MLGRTTRLFGAARYFWDTLREVNPAEVKAHLHLPFSIGLIGRSRAEREALAHAVFQPSSGEQIDDAVTCFDLQANVVSQVVSIDLAILLLDARAPDWSDERRCAHEIAKLGAPLILGISNMDLLPDASLVRRAVALHFPDHPPELVVVLDPADETAARRALAGVLINTVPRLRMALGYRFPHLRPAIAEDLIRETSLINAQFTLVSSLPAMLPLFGGLVGNMADILVLTKNQAMLVYKIAGIYGRDLDDRMGVLTEITPVVGAGFIWRSLARSTVGLFPTFIAALPKATVAFVGTYVTGEAARFYYHHGERPTPAQIQDMGRRAMEGARRMLPSPRR